MDARGRRNSSGYTGRIVAKADADQHEYGEGPCLTARATEKPVLLKDIQEEAVLQWLIRHGRDAGARAVGDANGL